MDMRRTPLVLSIKEKYGVSDVFNIYVKPSDQNAIVQLTQSMQFDNEPTTLTRQVINFMRQIFLPQGYPNSVSEDYYQYQLFDTLQAFCSRITGTITTKIILKSVGVGDAGATPLAAALLWIFKDGTGMVGSIFFAWWKGSQFDCDCKRWRLFADVLNDAAMFLEMLLTYFPQLSMLLLCLTTAMKAGVGVAGSATRAAITQHQAIMENMADVSAKDGSQETAVNLVASVFAVIVITVFREDGYDWYIFLLFTALHIFCNYLAVSSIIFSTLNINRMLIMMNRFVRYDTVSSPFVVNASEPVLPWHTLKEKDFCGFDIHLGQSLGECFHLFSFSNFQEIVEVYKNKRYIIVPQIHRRDISVVLLKTECPLDKLEAYFHAVVLALGICINDKTRLHIFNKNYVDNCFLQRLTNKLKIISEDEHGVTKLMTLIKLVSDFVDDELDDFLTVVEKKGWRIDINHIKADEWRLESLD